MKKIIFTLLLLFFLTFGFSVYAINNESEDDIKKKMEYGSN